MLKFMCLKDCLSNSELDHFRFQNGTHCEILVPEVVYTIPKYSFPIPVKDLVIFSAQKFGKNMFFDNLIDQKSFENVSNV